MRNSHSRLLDAIGLLGFLLGLWSPALARAQQAGEELRLRQVFENQVAPFLKTHCLSCHDEETQEAKLDLSPYRSVGDVAAHHQVWEIVLARLEADEMPPADAEPRPTQVERKTITDWIRAFRTFEANKNAGDPGSVLARRLSNSEYNYAIRDLTGRDIRPTKTFPIDPANAAGFDNSGESLTMSPALLKKYIEAARLVSEHMVLAPTRVAFAPHPVVTPTDRDKYCVKRIIAFYARQPTDLAAYFAFCRELERSGDSPKHLDSLAKDAQLSGGYVRKLWTLLHEPQAVGPTERLQAMFREAVASRETADTRRICVEMRNYAMTIRRRLSPRFEDLTISGSHKGSQPFVLWKNRQYAATRRTLARGALVNAADAASGAPRELVLPTNEARAEDFVQAVERFCDVIPNAFYISERGRDYLGKRREDQEKGRLLSAGFHSMMGYFRDDAPLYDLILDDAKRHELDRLWDELNCVASAPIRQYSGFLWFERTDSRYMRDPVFDFARPENKSAADRGMIDRLADAYIAKAKGLGGSDVAIQSIEHYFAEINQQIRRAERQRREGESHHLRWLVGFAEHAWRRTLSKAEQADMREFYESLRREGEMGHEDAMRDCCVSVLMSPYFLYRLDLASSGSGVRPLNGNELASRLSFFLWSSLPDRELVIAADDADFLQPDRIKATVRSMLRDARARALTTEFAANWLDIRRFEEHNAVDRRRFPQFTDQLRQAMFEEPLVFIEDLIRRDGSVLEMLEARHTFVNRDLARHYGIEPTKTGDEWRRVDRADQVGRGGLLPMAVFLTKNSPGLRTSPVKRGYWVVRRLLGERIPPPPPNVPDLPEDESQLGDLTLRETLAKHRDNKSCAGCHDRFDAIGLAFEGFGPIGELRKLDLGGRPVQTQADFPGPDGGSVEGEGVAGLRSYLLAHRQAEFVDNLCRKLLAFALGRTLQLSDESLIAKMKSQLRDDGFRFGSLIESIVSSRQFRFKRGRDSVAENPND